MKKSLAAFILLALSSSGVFSFEISSAENAINVSGKQRMLSQKILKNYAMEGMEMLYGNPKEKLKKLERAFSENLDALIAWADSNDPKAVPILKEEKNAWLRIQKIIDSDKKFKSPAQVKKDLEELLKIADKATKVLAEGKSSGKVIDIAGRQRMLSQKAAALYMFVVWNIEKEESKKELLSVIDEFKKANLFLEKHADKEISKLLGKAKKDFSFLDMMVHSKSKYVPSLVYKKSNSITETMDRAVKLYEKKQGGEK